MSENLAEEIARCGSRDCLEAQIEESFAAVENDALHKLVLVGFVRVFDETQQIRGSRPDHGPQLTMTRRAVEDSCAEEEFPRRSEMPCTPLSAYTVCTVPSPSGNGCTKKPSGNPGESQRQQACLGTKCTQAPSRTAGDSR
eukprot:m.610227 g.610227  ORF g.610227 m.610227 type:complete len:141 (-) comp58131_c0_seq12:117-539(-)